MPCPELTLFPSSPSLVVESYLTRLEQPPVKKKKKEKVLHIFNSKFITVLLLLMTDVSQQLMEMLGL